MGSVASGAYALSIVGLECHSANRVSGWKMVKKDLETYHLADRRSIRYLKRRDELFDPGWFARNVQAVN